MRPHAKAVAPTVISMAMLWAAPAGAVIGLTSAAPADGDEAGGTTVQITGMDFDGSITWRVPIIISNAGVARTNYSVLVTLDTAAIVAAGHMLATGDDIRFRDDGGGNLQYWVDYGIDTTETRIWVVVPSLPIGNTTIYLHYGDSSLLSQSDPNGQMGSLDVAVTDNFNDASIDSSKWGVFAGGGGTMNESGGEIWEQGDADWSGGNVFTVATFNKGDVVIADFSLRYPSAYGGGGNGKNLYVYNDAQSSFGGIYHSPSNGYSISLTVNSTYDIDARVVIYENATFSRTQLAGSMNWIADGEIVHDWSAMNDPFILNFHNSSYNRNTYWDDITIRRYDSAITVALGTEEVATAIAATFDGVAATSVTYVDPQTIDVVTPAHAPGPVDLVVTNPDMTFDTLFAGFLYTSAPQRGAFSALPSPITPGNNVGFSVSWTDNNSIRAHFCRTNAVTPSPTGGSCSGGTWASQPSLNALDPATVQHLVVPADVGTNDFYVFVCDDTSRCSATTGNMGSFEVVPEPPTFTIAPVDSSSQATPTNVGSDVTFMATATDPDDSYKLIVCKTDAVVPGVTPTCPGGTWCVDGTSRASGMASSCSYTVMPADQGAQTWFAFACDDSITPGCSPSSNSNSPFVGNEPPSFSGVGASPDPAAFNGIITFTGAAMDPNNNDVHLVVCKDASGTAGGCAPSQLWCVSASVAIAPACFTTLAGAAAGSHDYYAYVFDEFGVAAAPNPRQDSFTISGPSGTSCTSNAECSNNMCVDNVCCDTPCNGACDVCNASGTCVPRAPGDAGDPICAPYLCNGFSAACPSACGTNADCSPGSFCGMGGTCDGLLSAGATCTDPANCASGFCTDGVCCQTECVGSCSECDASGDGTCQTRLVGTTGSPSCSPYLCDGSSDTCPSTCSTGADCVTSSNCMVNECAGLKGLGADCVAGPECDSGICIDGVCCGTPCSDDCERCNLSVSVGTCTTAPAGLESSCAPYVCDGSGVNCPTSCADASDCVPGSPCSAGVCQGRSGPCTAGNCLPLGEPCVGGNQCGSGFCAEGVCCDSACDGADLTCTTEGSAGICAGKAGSGDVEGGCSQSGRSTAGWVLAILLVVPRRRRR